MDVRIIAEMFFTKEEIEDACRSIWGTVENGDIPLDYEVLIEEFTPALKRIAEYINKQQEYINQLVATRNNPIIITKES